MKSVGADEFYGRLKDYAGFKNREISKDVFLDVSGFIAGLLENGMAVNLPGVGKLEPVTRKATTVTLWGCKVDVPERVGVRFRASAKLKKKLNEK